MTAVSHAEMVAAVRWHVRKLESFATGRDATSYESDLNAMRAVLAVLERHELEAKVVEAARAFMVGEVQPAVRPTIEELEKILNSEPAGVRVAPDGSVFVKPSLDVLEAALAALDTAGKGENTDG